MEITAGARHIIHTPILRELSIAGILTVIAFGISETVAYAVTSSGLHRPPGFLGVLISLQGVGAVSSGAVAGKLMRARNEHYIVGLGLLSAALGFVLQVLPALPAVIAGFILFGASLPLIIIGIMTALQRYTAPGIMGRTESALSVAISVPQTASIAVGAALIAAVGFRPILVFISFLLASTAAFTLFKSKHNETAITDTIGAAGACTGKPPSPAFVASETVRARGIDDQLGEVGGGAGPGA